MFEKIFISPTKILKMHTVLKVVIKQLLGYHIPQYYIVISGI